VTEALVLVDTAFDESLMVLDASSSSSSLFSSTHVGVVVLIVV